MKIGMLFPDYASQFVGMTKELYDESRVMQEYFEEASNCLNINFVKLCFASSEVELSKVSNAYVALFLTSSAIAALLKQENIVPSLVAGYGIGEFSAITTAGGLSFPDGLYLLQKYAQFYQDVLPTLSVKMITVGGISTIKLKKIINRLSKHGIYIAAYNAPLETVIVGTPESIDVLITELESLNPEFIKTVPLEGGLHCEIMEPIIEQLKVYLAKVDFKDMTIPLVANVDAKIIIKGELAKNRLMKQLHNTLLWDKVLNSFQECDIILEIGPGTTLGRLIKAKYPSKFYISVNKRSDIDQIHTAINQINGQE